MKIWVIIASFAIIITGCLGQTNKNSDIRRYRGELSQPTEASIIIDSLVIDQFDETNIDILRRYIAGNSRWEMRQEQGKIYAIKKEKVDGEYKTSLNGYYSDFGNTLGIYQTRVIISFGQYYGHGNDENHITFSTYKDKNVQLTIEGEHSGTPGNSSYLIIKGEGINIEIYEQAKEIKRAFTSQTLEELNYELTDVLKYKEEIKQTGIIPLSKYYPVTYDSTFFNILDGMQPGIYVVQAGLTVDKEGEAYVKAFDTKDNSRLSADRMTPRTTRQIGWSENRKTVFPYETELTVYEGDWDNQYEARFEIWFRDKDGQERKLAEKTRQIFGWQR